MSPKSLFASCLAVFFVVLVPVMAANKPVTPTGVAKAVKIKKGAAVMKTLVIFYVADQGKSRDFYEEVLGDKPILDVPGMTEFKLGESHSVCLMPEKGIKALLGEKLPDPAKGNGIPRAELYLLVDDPGAYHKRALAAGAVEVKSLGQMPWGDTVAYSMDLDGNVLAFGKS